MSIYKADEMEWKGTCDGCGFTPPMCWSSRQFAWTQLRDRYGWRRTDWGGKPLRWLLACPGCQQNKSSQGA